jgi:hypothetical protein
MRPERELEAQVVAAKELGCPVDLIAIDQAEADWFAARLKGRHGVKDIGIKLGSPEDLVPMMDRVRGPGFEPAMQLPEGAAKAPRKRKPKAEPEAGDDEEWWN